MKAIDLYKFKYENDIECHFIDNDVIMFVNYDQIEEFRKILDTVIFDDEGINCIMKDGYFCFMMREICDYYDIDIQEIFNKKEK